MKSYKIIGTGGHAKSITESIQKAGSHVIWNENTQDLVTGLDNLIIGVGHNFSRYSVLQNCLNCKFGIAIHPSAVIAEGVEIGEGTVIMAGAIINTGCKIGKHCIVNTGAILEHDSVMEDFSSLAPRVVTGGNVRIGLRSSIGLGAIIKNKVIIGYDTVIGAGSLVLDEIGSLKVAYGSPCKEIRNRTADEKYL